MTGKLTHEVKGKVVDGQTRCVHYNSLQDVIAIKFKCCGAFYPCYECHLEEAGHKSSVWNKNEFDTKAILCGICDGVMSIKDYVACNNRCPFCGTLFNPGCSNHYHLYFEV